MTGAPASRYVGRLPRTTFLLTFASLFSDVSTEMLYPVLPIFLTQILHATGSIAVPRSPRRIRVRSIR